MSTQRGATQDTAQVTTGTRRALLIGVRDTAALARNPRLAAQYKPLVCVEGDVRRIEESLSASEYQVTSLHPGHPVEEHRDTSRDMIRQTVEDFFATCSPGDTALLYVSSHGVAIDGREYLVPSSARHHPDGSLNPRSLIETTVTDLLYGIPPEVTVVVCLDICRTDVPGAAPKLDKPLVGDEYENVVWLRAAGQGQAAFADPEKGSYFGLALSEALSASRPPKTLGKIHSFVRDRIVRLTDRLDGPSPAVELLAPEGRESWARELVLCEGSEETVRWAKIVGDSALWRHTSGTEACHEQVKHALGELAAEVARSRIDTEAPLSTPWHDPDYPERVVRILDRLVADARLEPHERLSPAETAALLAAPLLHEGVVAIALSELARLRPDRLDHWDTVRGADPTRAEDREACEGAADICRAHSRVRQAAETLRRRKLTDAATAADHWLRHRFIAEWDPLWERDGDYPAVDALVRMVVRAVSAGSEGACPRPSDVDQAVRRVLPHMTVTPGSTPRIDDSDDPGWSRVERPVPGNSWRNKELAYLLWLAALLAADPRRMSSVLVDHLGAHHPLAPSDVITAAAASGWEETTRGGLTVYALRLSCPHPALHAALEQLAATADGSVTGLHRKWHEAGSAAPDLLRGVPYQVTTEFLKPADRRYTKPLERVRLAEDEIRPLLMGTQLYGDRMLAVRELYQNALDACRYRQLRMLYGQKRGRYHGTGTMPEIRFVQAYDEGRPYIECGDDGAGMSREKLTSMFARAGKRYEQDPDYVQERRNWRRAGLLPAAFNSRFGIGVFSYFMLAEEVTVSTTAIDQHGNPDRAVPPLQATIQSGSGLLQIREGDDGPQLGGSTIRLYLSAEDDGKDPPSVVETLRRLLWVSAFRVSAIEYGPDGERIRSEIWEPERLQAPAARTAEWPEKPVDAGDGSWIVQGQGQLLLDGIVVEDAPKVHGYVFNLRERHRPVPSVNRNSLLEYDETGVRRELLASVPRASETLDAMSMDWLWSLAGSAPQLLVKLFDHAPQDACGLMDHHSSELTLTSARVPLRKAGVLSLDSGNSANGVSSSVWPYGGTAGRRLLDRWRATVLGFASPATPPFAPEGYPEPIGLDALLFAQGALQTPWTAPLTAAAQVEIPLAESLRALRRYAIVGVHVPSVRSITELREFGTPTRRLAALYVAYDNAFKGSSAPAAHAPLLFVAALHDMPAADLLDDVDRLVHLGIEIPDPSMLRSADLSMKLLPSEIQLLCVQSAELGIWLHGTVQPAELLARVPVPAQRRALVERLGQLEPLGFVLSDAVTEATADHRGLSSYQQKLVSRDADGVGPWLPAGALTMWQLLDRASRTDQSLEKVAADINAITAVTGVSAPDVPVACRTWVPPSWIERPETGAFSLPRLSPRTIFRSAWRLMFGAHRAEVRPTPDELRRTLALLGECVTLPAPAELIVAQFERTPSALVALLEEVFPGWPNAEDPWGFAAGDVGFPLLLRLASRRRSSLGVVADELTDADPQLPLSLPDLTDEARGLRPESAETDHLVHEGPDSRYEFKSRLAIKDVLAHSKARSCTLAESARALDAYRCVGAPAFPGPVDGPLATLRATDFDLAAFDHSLLGEESLGPLELVLVAGRFGWTLGAAYDRYAPFASLGLRVTTPEPEGAERDIVPGWADVIALTEELTGRLPRIQGTVTTEHIVLCAEETERSEGEALDLLRPYARLFELQLPAASGGPHP
ncbi:caspase family protein [Streptomyces sp. NPDC090025]|uniref:HD domain-containing protein n=1 Tax=Streptomyces sp. NPDC090025 TaxID=3365922 RepID=UPI0038390823